jgi:tetratricopeptide (TPR) repeat protein
MNMLALGFGNFRGFAACLTLFACAHWRMNRSLAITFLFLLTAGAPAVFAAGSRQMPVPQVPQVPQKTADAVTPYNEGVTLMNAKKFAAAQVKFEAALKANPNLAEAHNNLAYCLRKQSPENFASSLQHYNTALRLNPKLARAYEYRGVLFVEMGRKEDAQKDLATLKQLDPKLAVLLETAIKAGKDTDY